jgi:hypothetical protein
MDVYQIMTERIIEKLEQGTVPWHRPWRRPCAPARPAHRSCRKVQPEGQEAERQGGRFCPALLFRLQHRAMLSPRRGQCETDASPKNSRSTLPRHAIIS